MIKFNFITDFGATEGRLIIKQEPNIPDESDPIKEDYGSCADQRASLPPKGWGFPILLTFKGVIIDNFPKSLIAKIQSVRNLILLNSNKAKCGTLASHITKQNIDIPATINFQSLAPLSVETAAARFSVMEWRASISEIIRNLTESTCSTTLIIKEVFDEIGKPPCLFCKTSIKDSYEHARSGKCECAATNMSLQYLYASASEAIGKVGPCVPPERWTPPCPKWTPQYTHQNHQSLLITLRNASRFIIHEEANIGEIFRIKSCPPKDITAKHLDRINALLTNYPNGRIEYHLAKERGDGRAFAGSHSLQMAPGWIRAHACSELFDIDCDTSHPSNLIDALRFFKISVPKILFIFVTTKTEMRRKLANYYNTQKDNIKQLINSILYGASIENDTWFTENKINPIRHHADIMDLACAVAQCATNLTLKCTADYDFAKKIHPDGNEHKWKMTVLSELLVRIEEQKLTCIITRLIDHWGINPKSIIPMHDGAMISLRNLHPRKELSKAYKPTIDKTVLEDVTLYVRKTMGVFLKLTVKKGHEATELICGVPWPSIECLNETPQKTSH
jgi:hypothetical protein